jgi:hypothetical protein
MYKTAAEHVKLAYLSGTAVAMCQFGLPPELVVRSLMEKGASAYEAEYLTKEAAAQRARGLGWVGSKALPWIAKGLGGFAARGGAQAAAKGSQLALPGMASAGVRGPAGAGTVNAIANWGSGVANKAGTAFNAAAKGMETNPWGTLGQGAKGFAHGAVMGGGKGIGSAMGKGTLAYGVGSTMLG